MISVLMKTLAPSLRAQVQFNLGATPTFAGVKNSCRMPLVQKTMDPCFAATEYLAVSLSLIWSVLKNAPPRKSSSITLFGSATLLCPTASSYRNQSLRHASNPHRWVMFRTMCSAASDVELARVKLRLTRLHLQRVCLEADQGHGIRIKFRNGSSSLLNADVRLDLELPIEPQSDLPCKLLGLSHKPRVESAVLDSSFVPNC